MKKFIGIILIATVFTSCCAVFGLNCAQMNQYTMTGTVTVLNDCDGLQASIPNQIELQTGLNGPNGGFVGKKLIVNIVPDPTQPNNPIKTGTYTTTVSYPGNAISWKIPRVLAIGGGSACKVIPCPDPTKQCDDRGTLPAIVLINPNGNTIVNTTASCGCQ